MSENRKLLYSQTLRDEDVCRSVIDQCTELGIVVSATYLQQQALLGYIRHLSSAAKRLSGSKKKSFLQKFYDWTVDAVTKNSKTAQQKLDDLAIEKYKLLQRIEQLEQEAKEKEKVLLEEKTRAEKLKHRPTTYSIKRDARTSPYSRSHQHRIKKKLRDLSAQYGIDTPADKENMAPATACRMVDSANISLRQYHLITKHLPQTPKLHRVKEERKR